MARSGHAQEEIRRFLDIGAVQVAELDLDGDEAVLRPGPGSPPVTHGEVFVLVRRRGRPVGTLLGRVPEGADAKTVLAARARAEYAAVQGGEPGEGGGAGEPPYASVVVATRERAGQLARALDSLLAQDHPRFEIVVVDNAPVTSETRELIERKYAERVRYVCEPVPGLAVAHNTGLAAVRGEVVAFTDDDVVADPRWLTELTVPFAADPGLGCSTGLILPARLTTPAQVLLESHGGFAKGFTPRTYDPARPPGDEPLFPFTAGRFGSGANMAFRTAALRSVGGFDPATGAGTAARGGDDLYGFVRVLAQGHRLRYTPSALVWHHHRETWQDLETQAYGYGAGLTAYLTAVLVNRPALLPAFLAKLPRGLAHARALTAVRETEGGGAPGDHDTRTHPWPRRLSRLQRRGMVYGPVGYLRARRALRTRGEGAR
ncbi:putative mycofactocin biosynthesis glycosyltransferase MftF [Streptomyces afghaniensis 772]|uniref:Putative mycofactocin biosynthesis glycosyltransferase MftF n=1 Tax=Streptomyces afghaniensis 772 TaxID=1283301 RepID=S4MXC4_9ACTN|nr:MULTISPECIES: glycosyltransferase [Streptomyces]EPJ38482.1 putative mycofactocin biosynthesis glycosyltransferase MftF [Streptomyces afghaniensis 772]UOB10942.1 glycosyltransferase [Streptomyces sp. HP-A2021]